MSTAPGQLIVVRAAAGCGKTTDLARRYLRFIRDGLDVQHTIAITFTRRAAAELQERVSLALQAAGTGHAADKARDRLGGAWPLYQEAAPDDPEVLANALEGLPDAPIGTTDAFVQRLLTEFAVDARLPLPTGTEVPLDVPIRPHRGAIRSLDRAARRILDPPEGGIDPDVAALLDHLTLSEIRETVVRRSPLDDLAPAMAAEVLLALARDLAEVVGRHDLVSVYGPTDPTSVTAWQEALGPKTNVSGKWAIPDVARWLAAGSPRSDVPLELTGWLVGLNTRSADRKAIQQALQSEERDLGMGRLALWDVVRALEYPYDEAGHVDLADQLRQRIHRLRQRVVAIGLQDAALEGELGYEELLDAAIHLCSHPPDRLKGRFRALLVDEVQDANPAQLRLYRAIARMEGPVPIRAYFVGDPRQSIYLFRNAEPQGLLDLEAEGKRAGQEPIDLVVNHRSAPLLVQAQRDLMSAIDAPMQQLRWRPPASLDALGWRDDNDHLTLDPAHHDPADPVWLVTHADADAMEADRRALYTFLQRVQAAWGEPGHDSDTAVVLAPTWRRATRACQQLRRWVGRDNIAWIDGATGWPTSRVGTDVALLLRALLDPSDDIAWLGVLKHPAVGFSDAALARIRSGVGLVVEAEQPPTAPIPAPDRCRTLGWILDADALDDPHAPVDRLAFARARDPLRTARRRIGRTGTAEVVDTVTHQLRWRAVLSAGPGGVDDVAQLEVLLDWLRTLDDDGVSPDGIVALLDEPDGEIPHLHLVRSGQHIICTTIHQAKGLAWDHVCIQGAGWVPSGGDRQTPAWMDHDGKRVRLEGIRFDPYGGVTPFLDPLGRLATRLHQHRQGEESARLAYVALTRGRRSVTVGLPGRGRRREHDVSTLIKDAWLAPGFRPPGVARVEVGPVRGQRQSPTGFCAPTEVDAMWAPAVVPAGREERAPSSMGAHLDRDQREQLAEGVLARIRLANGLHVGGPPVVPSGTDPVTGRTIPGHPLDILAPMDWGDIAHGWLARWGFDGDPDRTEVDAYLDEVWGRADPDVAAWILAMCRRLASVQGPLWERVRAPGVTLHFELPFVGIGTQQDREILLSGRTDLMIEHPGRHLWIVDFKAGLQAPTGWDDLADAASVRTHAPQLEGYAEAMRRMGYNVDIVALWFARTGTSILWTP